MDLDTKIGQMLMAGFRGCEVGEDHPVVRDIRECHLGHVVLFDYDVPLKQPGRNIRSREQVETLVESLQSFADIPLLVAVDQEGGAVRRLRQEIGFPPVPSARQMGQGPVERTREYARQTARELAALGIYWNLAPVVDLDRNPANPVIGERSFGSDAGAVSAHAAAFVEAHRAHGVRCALKHFPGHGSASADSHLGMVDVTRTWDREELEPYRLLIERGLADAVMTAHVFHGEIDAQWPATLSQWTIDGLLRGELGFDGVVVSDDLQMGAITTQYGFETAVWRALEAGVDVLVLANNTLYEEGAVQRAFAFVRGLVEQGRLGEARIDASWRRIEKFKRGTG